MHSQGDRALRQLWGIEAPSARGPKAKLSLEQLAEAGVELADESGLGGVALSRVAARVGLTTTAVYRYVSSKSELIDLMIDAAIGDPPDLAGAGSPATSATGTSPTPSVTDIPASDWQSDCREWSHRLVERYLAHPWLCDVRPTRMPVQPRAYAWISALVTAVSGRVAADPLRIALLLDGLVRSSAALGRDLEDPQPVDWLEGAVRRRFPALSGTGGRERPDARPELDFAIDTVLAGLATRG